MIGMFFVWSSFFSISVASSPEIVEDADNGRARTLQFEIEGLLREKDEIEKWAVVGSA